MARTSDDSPSINVLSRLADRMLSYGDDPGLTPFATISSAISRIWSGKNVWMAAAAGFGHAAANTIIPAVTVADIFDAIRLSSFPRAKPFERDSPDTWRAMMTIMVHGKTPVQGSWRLLPGHKHAFHGMRFTQIRGTLSQDRSRP